MKEFLKKSYPVLGILLVAIVVLIGKRCCKTDDTTSTGNPKTPQGEAVKSPVAIAFIDANRFLNTRITKVKVTLIDPNGKVLTSNGLPFTTMDVSDGVISLAFKQDAALNQQNPYRFTIKAEAEGYSSTINNILVASEEGQYMPIFMVKLDDLPVGMASAVGAASLNNGIIDTTLTLNPNKTNGVPIKKVSIEIEKGTQLLYCDRDAPNAKVPLKLNYRISYASPQSTAASRTFPAGPLVTDALGMDGTIIAQPKSPFYFATAGWINLEMDADGNKVSSFSKPVIVTMPIPDSLPNPQTGQFYKAGDNIDVWSLSDQGVWRQESASKVEGPTGDLSAKMTVTHLSSWNLDIKQNVCGGLGTPTNATITYTNSQTTPLNAYTEVRTTGNAILQGFSSRYLSYLSGANTHTLYNFPDNIGSMKVQVLQYGPGTPIAAESTPFSCTSPNANLNISSGGMQTMILEFQVGISTPDVALCNQILWYQACSGACPAGCASSSNSYQFGGYLSLIAGSASEVRFSKPLVAGRDINCILIWQAENVGGVAQEVSIVFPVDFSRQSAVYETIQADKRVNGTGPVTPINVRHWYDTFGKHHFLFDSSTFPLYTPCPPPIG